MFCNSDVFRVVNMYHDHLKFYVVCINGRRYVYCSEYYILMINSPPALCNLSLRTAVKLYNVSVFSFRGELGSLIVMTSACVL